MQNGGVVGGEKDHHHRNGRAKNVVLNGGDTLRSQRGEATARRDTSVNGSSKGCSHMTEGVVLSAPQDQKHQKNNQKIPKRKIRREARSSMEEIFLKASTGLKNRKASQKKCSIVIAKTT